MTGISRKNGRGYVVREANVTAPELSRVFSDCSTDYSRVDLVFVAHAFFGQEQPF
jgi:hypothetical protein